MDAEISYEDVFVLQDDDLAWLKGAILPGPNELENATPVDDDPNHLPSFASSIDIQQPENNAGLSNLADQQPASTQNATPATGEDTEGHGMAEEPKKTRRRKGDPEPDYSELSRRKVQNNKRTGQACDRCKVCLCSPLIGSSTFHILLLANPGNCRYTVLTAPLA